MGLAFDLDDTGPVTIAFEPFTDAQMGIQGRVPQGWTPAGTGVYVRGKSALDVTAVVVQAVPLTDALLQLLVTQLGLDGVPQAASDDLSLVVLLQSDSYGRDRLCEGLCR